ncbi:hypothetical protein GUJ93_ZPchr0012g19537 [Zizania palustris]|uniref:Uncharacterized protein n=1 Tax=Zizania palustris TaxID=103762 RepID=A0A8J6BUH4_ZIZPA|nr:hypothetical protein GUJ93_ZPchr0012g19537 [Zizania palustris]
MADPSFSGEWTAYELAQARSIVLARTNNAAAGDDTNSNGAILRELEVSFPGKTTKQVIDLYVQLAVEMAQQVAEEQHPNVVDAANLVVIPSSFELANDNFGIVPEPSMGVETSSAMNIYGGGPPAPAPVVVIENQDDEVEVNDQLSSGQQAAPNNAKRFWTTEEHRQFLRGLRVYGRGDWKNISKYFVTTKTPVQVSSHAQKYFRRMERSAATKQRYSINDVGLDNPVPRGAANSNNNTNYGGWPALAFAGGHLDRPAAGYGGQPQAQQANSSVATMNNVAHLWAHALFNPQQAHAHANLMQQQQQQQHALFNPQQAHAHAHANLMQQHHHQQHAHQQQEAWIDQQMIAPAPSPSPMEGTGNIFVPAASDLLFNPQPQANLQQQQGWIDQQMIAPAPAPAPSPMEGTGNIFVPAASDLLFNPQSQANLLQQQQGWIDQQMIAPAPMDGTGNNIVPAASPDLSVQWMMNNNNMF